MCPPAGAGYLGTLRNHFSTIGVNGINEMIRNFSDDTHDIAAPEGHALAVRFLDHIRVTGIPGSGESARMSAALVRTSGVSRQFRTTLDPWLLEGGRLERLQEMVTVGWGEKVVIQQMT